MKKKLRLHRTTIAILSGQGLSGVNAAFIGISGGASVQSVIVNGEVEPCQWPEPTMTCDPGK